MGYGLHNWFIKSSRTVLEKQTKEGESPVYERWDDKVESRVVRDTRNLVWISGDHPVRLNTNWWPIVNKYREGKVKRTPGGEWNRNWNPMFTSRQSELRRDVVLFVERSSELLYMARLSRKEDTEPKRKRVWIVRRKVMCNRPETGWPIHGQDETRVKSSGGPNWLSLKRHRMNCG